MAQAPRPLPDAPAVRERPDRAEAVATDRRRRKASDASGVQLKMRVPPALKEPGGACDPAKWSTRWINDDRMRLRDLTVEDDWEIVSADGATVGVDNEGAVRYQVGTKPEGGPLYAYLCRKLAEFAAQDAVEKVKSVDALEKARLSKVPDDAPGQSYTPKR